MLIELGIRQDPEAEKRTQSLVEHLSNLQDDVAGLWRNIAVEAINQGELLFAEEGVLVEALSHTYSGSSRTVLLSHLLLESQGLNERKGLSLDALTKLFFKWGRVYTNFLLKKTPSNMSVSDSTVCRMIHDTLLALIYIKSTQIKENKAE